jgi:hypothetical protein
MNNKEIFEILNQIGSIYAAAGGGKGVLRKLFYDLESELMEVGSVHDEVFSELIYLLRGDNFHSNANSSYAIMFISNIFDKFNVIQRGAVYDELFIICIKPEAGRIEHSIGDFVARKYDKTVAIDFCKRLIKKIEKDEKRKAPTPGVSSLSAAIFVLNAHAKEFTVEQQIVFNEIINFYKSFK